MLMLVVRRPPLPLPYEKGICAWLTGLSGSGKTTTAESLQAALEEKGRRTTVLDGDAVREHLSKGLGFSKADRDTNVLRVGYVASQVVYHGGVAICALISPYEETRNRVREMFTANHFLEIYVSTPLEVCEERDTKGHYARARRGEMTGLTGIDDRYEVPTNPDIALDTTNATVAQNTQSILDILVARNLI